MAYAKLLLLIVTLYYSEMQAILQQDGPSGATPPVCCPPPHRRICRPIPWLYWYDLGQFSVPSIALPIAIVALYVIWLTLGRPGETRVDSLFATFQFDNKPASSSATEGKADSKEKGQRNDEESQLASNAEDAHKSSFSKFKTIFVGILRQYAIQCLIPSPDPTLPSIVAGTAYAYSYYIQIAIVLLDGAVSKPKAHRPAFMLAGAWILLLLRDVKVYVPTVLMSDNAKTVMTILALLTILLGIPMTVPANNAMYMVMVLMSGAGVLVRVITILLGSQWLPSDVERSWMWCMVKYAGYIVCLSGWWHLVALVSTTFGTRRANQSATLSMHTLSNKLKATLKEVVVGAMVVIPHVTAILTTIAAACCVTSFLASCIGLSRFLFGSPPSRPSLDIGALCLVSYLLYLPLLCLSLWLRTPRGFQHTRKNPFTVLVVTEPIVWTLAVCLTLAVAGFSK